MLDRRIYRCAIYTRVSTDHGLEQEFNSLHAQREACEAYIKSQAGEGWRVVANLYDDGGYSGGSMERPALQRLLEDIRLGKLDIIVVYKVDRLTRSLAHFAKLVERFDQQGITFVSITQSFNTTTSMGRLTLNVLLSFAQFEREVTGERIRDKIAASKRKGMRVGGPVALGYAVKDKKLVVEPEEADTVQSIFEGYLVQGSLVNLVIDLNARGVVTKKTLRRDGSVRGGRPFQKSALACLLRNRTYVGDVVHKGKRYKGEHEAIVPTDLYEAVQHKLDEQTTSEGGIRVNTASPLIGLLHDDENNRMTPASANKRGLRYRYYISSALAGGNKAKAGSIVRVPATEIEEAVKAAILEKLPALDPVPANPEAGDATTAFGKLQRVTVRQGALEISLKPDSSAVPANFTVPWSPPRSRRRRELIPIEGARSHRPIRADTRARLVEGVAMARAWLDELLTGKVVSTHDIALREQISERSVRMTLNLAFLSPTLTKAAVEGTLPDGFGMVNLAEQDIDWAKQGRF